MALFFVFLLLFFAISTPNFYAHDSDTPNSSELAEVIHKEDAENEPAVESLPPLEEPTDNQSHVSDVPQEENISPSGFQLEEKIANVLSLLAVNLEKIKEDTIVKKEEPKKDPDGLRKLPNGQSYIDDRKMFFVGAELGHDFGSAKVRSNINSAIVTGLLSDIDYGVTALELVSHNMAMNNYYIKPMTGFKSFVDEHFMFGIDIFGTINSNNSNYSTVDFVLPTNERITLMRHSLSLKYSVGAAFNFGAVLTKDFSGYFSVGYVRGTFRTTTELLDLTVGGLEKDYTRNGYKLGFALEGQLSKLLSIGLKYNFASYQSFESTTTFTQWNAGLAALGKNVNEVPAPFKNFYKPYSNELGVFIDFNF